MVRDSPSERLGAILRRSVSDLTLVEFKLNPHPAKRSARLLETCGGLLYLRQSWHWDAGKLTASMLDEMGALTEDALVRALATEEGIQLEL